MKNMKLKNGKIPLLLRRYKRHSVLSPSKNWFRNFINRRTVLSRNDFEVISTIGFVIASSFAAILVLAVFMGLLGVAETYSMEIAITSLINTRFLYVLALLSVLPLPAIAFGFLGRKGKFKDYERVELKLPEHLSKHLDKVPEELIHKIHDSMMDYQELKKILNEIDETLSKGMTRFLREELLKKREEILQEAEKSQNDAERTLLQIKSVLTKFAEIDKMHKKQDEKNKKQSEIKENDKEVLKVLSMLSKDIDDEIEYAKTEEKEFLKRSSHFK